MDNMNKNSPNFSMVAKVSLWKSQKKTIENLFQWAESHSFSWKWFETIYEVKKEAISSSEISFVFFLEPDSVPAFKKEISAEWKAYIRWESFSRELFDYYRNVSSSNPVIKHPDTP